MWSVENRGFYELRLTPPVFDSHLGGVSIAPDRSYWGQWEEGPYSYAAVQLFSKKAYSNLCENHTDGQMACNLITALYVASRGNKQYLSAYRPYLIFLETTLTGVHFAADSLT